MKKAPTEEQLVRKAIRNATLGKDDSLFFHKWTDSIKRWVKADAKKRGYQVDFSSDRIKFSTTNWKQVQEADKRASDFWHNWINSPG